MLAGVGGIDLAMLVVAADEGVMPQTREHLAICSLLRIKGGLVVLTKTDLVEPDWLALVRDDVATLVRATFLEGAPILAVSAKTGDGLAELRAALRGLAEVVEPRGLDQLPRLPIDRVFTVRGFGTVVTGTLTAGRLAVDDRIQVYPKGVEAKIRGLQTHGHPVAEAFAGQRTAINLQGVERTAVERGDVVGPAGTLVSSLLVDGALELLEDAPRAGKSRTRVRFPVGTSGIMARVLLPDPPQLGPGPTASARLPLLGRVPFGPEKLRGLLDRLVAQGRVLAVDREWYLHPESSARFRALAVAALEAFHRANPLKPGMSREELRVRAGGADERVFATLVVALETEGIVATERDKVRLASHRVRLTPEQQRIVDRVEQEFLKAEASPPSPEEALGRAGVSGGDQHELFQFLLEGKRLVRVKESLYFHAAALDAIQDKVIALLRERKEIGPGDIKDLLGISRKYAIPLLEHLDARRVTVRVGEKRVLRGG